MEKHPFHEWIRLEQPRLGTRVVYATDDFFAPKERMIAATEPVFLPDEYDDHGKWMDGWESRRKRTPGNDYCVIRLGVPGTVHGLDIDTRFFTGNFPPEASVDACCCDDEQPGDAADWQTLVPRLPLTGDAHNFVSVPAPRFVTHLRLNIFPDGGVARLRIFGEVQPGRIDSKATRPIDLVALENGGRALCCSDEHYGSMHNLNVSGSAINMGDGWETARRRGPGNDWVVLSLGIPGTIEEVQLDTAFFKGNYPDRAEIRAAFEPAKEGIASASEHWPLLLPAARLQADHLHRFVRELASIGPVTHLRLNIYPDGGVSRLRILGMPVPAKDLS